MGGGLAHWEWSSGPCVSGLTAESQGLRALPIVRGVKDSPHQALEAASRRLAAAVQTLESAAAGLESRLKDATATIAKVSSERDAQSAEAARLSRDVSTLEALHADLSARLDATIAQVREAMNG